MKKTILLSMPFIILLTFVYKQQAQSVMTPPNKKVLFVLSGVDFLEGNKNNRKTGYWLEEVSVPYSILSKASVEVVFATPNGHRPKADALSYAVDASGNPLYMASKKDLDEALRFKKHIMDQAEIQSLAVLAKDGLDFFDAIFFPGGHGPMQDLAFDANVANALNHFHTTQKPTALLCHGPAALLSTAFQGNFLYTGYQVSGYTNTEEEGTVYDQIGGFKALGMKLETALIQAGVNYQKGPDYEPFVIQDRELITGQNPASSRVVAENLLKQLK